MRAFNVTPHVAQNIIARRSAIDGRTTRHSGYEISQRKRKRVEEPFGWGKTIGGLARPMLRGVKKLDFKFIWTMAAYDLIKLPRLIGAARLMAAKKSNAGWFGKEDGVAPKPRETQQFGAIFSGLF
jgi:hypothetical protein